MSTPLGRSARKSLAIIVRAAALLMLSAVALLTMLLLVMWWEHRTVVTLPSPSGPFTIGRTTFGWTSSTREVMVWMWYPAVHIPQEASSEYIPAAWRAAVADHLGAPMRWFFKHDPARVNTHSQANVVPPAAPAAFPVVLLRAGGSALTTDFTTLAEDLASHGYIVAGFDAPYRSFVFVRDNGQVVARAPDYNVENANGDLGDPLIGKLLAMWTSDARFVVDQMERLNDDRSQPFAGRLDLRRLGIFGHSFGGAAALQFCHEDSRCKAAIDLDGIPFGSVVVDGATVPTLFVLSDHSRDLTDSPTSLQVLARIRSIYDRLPAGDRLYLTIRTANHFSFSDQILLNSPIAMSVLGAAVGFGGLDGRRGLAIVADLVHTFFNVHLGGMPAASLHRLSVQYEEIRSEGLERSP